MDLAEDGESVLNEDEYNVQYFGFSPQTFMNGMYNAIVEYLQEGISALNDTILNMFAGKVSETELKEISIKQGQIAIKRLDAHFEKAEVYLRKNVFSVPAHIVLPEDQIHLESTVSVEDMDDLDQDIQAVTDRIIAGGSLKEMDYLDQDIQASLTDRIIAVKYANASLAERISEIETLQTQFNTSLKTLQTTHTEVSSQSKNYIESADALTHINRHLESVKLE